MKTKTVIAITALLVNKVAIGAPVTDVGGVALGMSPTEAKSAMQAFSNLPEQKTYKFASGSIGAIHGSRADKTNAFEAIAINFTERSHNVISIVRYIGFPDGALPTTKALAESLMQKYGKPSATDPSVHGLHIVWQYTLNGELMTWGQGQSYADDICDPGHHNRSVGPVYLAIPETFKDGCGLRIMANIGAPAEQPKTRAEIGKPGVFVRGLTVESVDVHAAYAELKQQVDAQSELQEQEKRRRIQQGEGIKVKL